MYITAILLTLTVGGLIAACVGWMIRRARDIEGPGLDVIVELDSQRYKAAVQTAVTGTILAVLFFMFGLLPVAAEHGEVLFLLPTLILGTVFVAITIAEFQGGAPPAPRRSASLVHRSFWHIVPRLSGALLALSVVFSVALVIYGNVLGTVDEDGRPGRGAGFSCPDSGFSKFFGPFPGSFYSPWLYGALAVSLVVVGAAAVLIARRAATGQLGPVADNLLRQNSVSRMFSAGAVVIGGQASFLAGFITESLLDFTREEHCATAFFAQHAMATGLIGAAVTVTTLAAVFVFFQGTKFSQITIPG